MIELRSALTEANIPCGVAYLFNSHVITSLKQDK
jgi:hypothetical protein